MKTKVGANKNTKSLTKTTHGEHFAELYYAYCVHAFVNNIQRCDTKLKRKPLYT